MTSDETITTHSGGRPKKPVKRDIVKGIRFTKSEFYVVKQKAAKAGIGISSFTAGAPISPQYDNSNFGTNTICSATLCDSIPPISDSCTSGTVITYNSHYTNLLTGIIKGTDGNYYMAGEHFFDMSLEPLIVKTKPNGEVVWSKTYNQDIKGASFIKILATSDNKILVAGENNLTLNHGSGDSVMLMKVDYNGKVIWARNYSRGGYSSNVNDIISSNDGGFFMVITEGWGGGSTYTVVTRIDKNGTILCKKKSRLMEARRFSGQLLSMEKISLWPRITMQSAASLI